MRQIIAGLLFYLLLPLNVQAAFICAEDVGGVDDLAGSAQADVTQICYDNDDLPTSYDITLNWDETGFSGKNTGDGCALFDTDADAFGLIDWAICVQLEGNPSTLKAGSPYIYECTSPDSQVACGGATSQAITAGTFCSVSISSDDPFPTGDDTPNDSKVTCTISTVDIPAGGLQINFCTYPSASPTSDPKDCVSSIGGAQIFLTKDALPVDSTTFSFDTTSLGGFSQTDTVVGSGGLIIDVDPGNYSISEALVTNWGLESVTCEDRNGNSIGTFDSATRTISGLTMAIAARTTCTFTNRKSADLQITKSDAQATYTPGATATYLITVFNDGPASLSGALVEDTIPNNLTINSISCNLGATCSISQTGQDIDVTMDINNQETVTISVSVTYPTDPSAY